jgi:excisionase family DNA binding protein
MDIDDMSVQEVARYLNKSEKTIYRWLDTGKLHSEQIRGLHFIKRAEVEALASPGVATTDQTQRLDIIEKRLDSHYDLLQSHDFRTSTIEQQLEALTLRVDELARIVYTSALQEPAQPPQGRAQLVKSTIPDGYVLVTHFNTAHGMSDTSVSRRVDEHIIEITRGEWKYGRTVTRQLLSPAQQRRYWQALHNYPGFTECEDCPHE